MKIRVRAFGPGVPPAGISADAEADLEGLRIQWPGGNVVSPRWSGVTWQRTGWDGNQLNIEWSNGADRFVVSVADAQAARDVVRLAGAGSMQRRSRAARGPLALLWIVILSLGVLPLILLGTLVWQHDRLVGWVVSQVSIEQETRLGEALFTHHKARLKLVEGPVRDMVNQLGERLTRGSRYRYRFFVAEDPSVNGYAMPGGFIVLHTGLLKSARRAEEVAGVLAHEAAHIESRHGLRGMAQSLGLRAVMGLLLGDTGVLISLGGDLLQLKFSRDHETEADREAVKVLVRERIDPRGLRDFFGALARETKVDLGILSTHPASEDRMADMDRAIAALPPEARSFAPLAIDAGADFPNLRLGDARAGPR